VSSAMSPFRAGIHFLKETANELSDELRYRKYSLDQYREDISSKVSESIEKFRRDQKDKTLMAERDFELYVEKLDALFRESLIALDRQKTKVEELRRRTVIQRPPNIDDSLEQFKMNYNESIIFGPYEMLRKKWKWNFLSERIVKKNKPRSESDRMDDSYLERDIEIQIKLLTDRLQGTIGRVTKTAAEDLSKFQEDLTASAKALAVSRQKSINITIDKRDFRRETRDLEEQLRELNREGSLWVANKISSMEVSLRAVQDTLLEKEKEFEDLIFKKDLNIQYSVQNDASLNQVLKLIDPTDKGWKLVKSEDDSQVLRKFLTGPSAQYACVMCHGIIKSPVRDVLSLFEDNARVSEYNSFCKEIRDVELIADDTKVVWIGSPAIFPFKPRDFCTIVHIRKLKDGTIVVLNRAIKHANAPVTGEYERAAIVLAANIIQPIKGSPNRCKLTMITQVDPGGFVPPVLMNHMCTLGPIGFLKNIELAAKKKPKRGGFKLVIS
jgi:hypothetical protein